MQKFNKKANHVSVDKYLPHNFLAEKMVLCCLFFDSEAIEIALQNFIKGKILVVQTGYYSDRIYKILNFLKYNFKKIQQIDSISWMKIRNIKKSSSHKVEKIARY